MTAISAFVEGAVGCAPEILNLRRGVRGWGVESGCTPSEKSGGADMSIDVAAGYYWVNGKRYTYAGGNQPLAAADATNPRWDTVALNSSGLVYTQGTAAAEPEMPSIPANATMVASIYVAATVTEVTDDVIRDERVTVIPSYYDTSTGSVSVSSGAWTSLNSYSVPALSAEMLRVAFHFRFSKTTGGGGGDDVAVRFKFTKGAVTWTTATVTLIHDLGNYSDVSAIFVGELVTATGINVAAGLFGWDSGAKGAGSRETTNNIDYSSTFTFEIEVYQNGTGAETFYYDGFRIQGVQA